MENFGKTLGAVTAVFIVFVAFAYFFGWLTMLAVGAVHSIFDWPQTISYVQGIQLAGVIFLFGWIFDLASITNKSK
jgi:hypothetical protein